MFVRNVFQSDIFSNLKFEMVTVMTVMILKLLVIYV